MAKILIIDKCWDCKWFNHGSCIEPKRTKGTYVDIPNAFIIDPGCQLEDAKE